MFKEKSLWVMLFLGFSAGLPLSLVFGTLSLWLNEAGVSKSTITFFSWAGLGYGFKFVWAPLIDQMRLPLLTQWLGRRRSWLLLCQLLLLVVLAAMALVNPVSTNYSLTLMALLAVALGFLSASQDIVLDAYRIEITPKKFLGLSASTYSLGYRLAMIVSGAVALILSEKFGSTKENYLYVAWQKTYLIMALLMLVGIVATLIGSEPRNAGEPLDSTGSKQLLKLFVLLLIPFIGVLYLWYPLLSLVMPVAEFGPLAKLLSGILRFITALLACYLVAVWLVRLGVVQMRIAGQAYWEPIKEFIQRYPLKLVILLLLLIGFYRVSDLVLGIIANVFYQDMGFSKTQIGTISKGFGIAVTLLGTFVGGYLIMRFGVMRMMMIGAITAAATNVLFMLLAVAGDQVWLLIAVIAADNLAGGVASIAFVTFLSRLSNIQFTAMQYAIFSSLFALLPRFIGGYSGTIVEATNYQTFFFISALMGLPVVLLVWLVSRSMVLDDE